MNELEAKEILRGMCLMDMIELWNEDARLHGKYLSTVHKMSDESWWNELFRRNSSVWNLLIHFLHSNEMFNTSDMWFFWDEDCGYFASFSTKQEWLEITEEDFFLYAIMNKHN